MRFDRQPLRDLTFDRQPSKSKKFDRQPSTVKTSFSYPPLKSSFELTPA